MSHSQDLQSFLQTPASYPEGSAQIQLRETHISQVFLTEHEAYKLKKPLKLPFLDYGSLEARHQACMAELELNQRFSYGIYRDVVAITREAAGLAWNGSGPVVEYLVRMRRIPDHCLMEQKLKEQSLSRAEQEQLIAHLQRCYAAAPEANLEAETYWNRMDGLVAENRSSLYELSLQLSLDPLPWLALASQQALFLRIYREDFFNRVRTGCIIEGHGDLRPEHIVLEEQVSLIDGIEFNRDFRVLDIADELSFLACECAVLGYSELGAAIRARVLAALQATAEPGLLAFYESHRALVRAKVNLIKAQQLAGEARASAISRAQVYQDLANSRLASSIVPFIFLVAGAMGSGKSTLALALKKELGAVHLESDALRRELLGKSSREEAYGQGHYTPELREQIYAYMAERALFYIKSGMTVILDASFGEPTHRDLVIAALRREGQPFLVLLCECSDAEAVRRIAKRRQEQASSLSEARPELFAEQKRLGDWSFAGLPLCRINSEQPLVAGLPRIFTEAARILKSQSLGSHCLSRS